MKRWPEYKGTTLEKEFRQMEQDIIDGKEGAEVTVPCRNVLPEDLNAICRKERLPPKNYAGYSGALRRRSWTYHRSIKIVNGRKAFFNNLEPVKISPEMKHIFDANAGDRR